MKLLRQRCTDTGTLLILDEIQTGFGRTGKLFAFEHFDVIPDILLIAKGMAGGMPMGAFISSSNIMGVLSHQPILGHISTFGGHPVCCAAGLATLQVIQSEKLVDAVEQKGAIFRKLLVHPGIREVRIIGLMIAVEFKDFDFNKKIIDRCIEHGIITDWFLHCDHSMRIAPPLIITENEIEKACNVIIEAIDYFHKG
jgi:acetylornithine/succinyldiaminopimelate/putrescine aminotransferase